MKVFISWSKGRSRAVAEALRDWLPDIIQNVEPWVSSEDIDAGKRWSTEIATQLAETKFGIICVTPENQEAPWILFETGALAKTIENTNVCPYLIGLEKSDLQPGPLTQFQAMEANKEETWKLVRTINKSLDRSERLEESRLKRVFERSWSTLDNALGNLSKVKQGIEPKRDVEEMTEEILELVRDISRQQKNSTSSEGASSGITSFWHAVLSKADSQLRAFLEPADVIISKRDESAIHFLISLDYSDDHRFHFTQIKRRQEELVEIMNEVASFDFTSDVTVSGPGEDITFPIGYAF